MKTKNANKKGFTLVELLVVLAIIGLLAGIGIPMILNVQRASRNSARLKQLEPVNGAATDFFTKNNTNPTITVASGVVSVGSGSNITTLSATSPYTYSLVATCAGNASADNNVNFRVNTTGTAGEVVLCREGGGEDVLRFKQ